MKHALFIFIVLSNFLACQNVVDSFGGGSDSTATASAGNVVQPVTRDLSITEANAYSDLFLDSTVMEGFIQQNKLDGAQAQQMRNFYNTRNYQFAWFTSHGITEQGRGFWNLYDYSQHGDNESQQDKQLHGEMDTLLMEDSVTFTAADSVVLHTELQLTRNFLNYTQNNTNDSLHLASLQQFIPVKKETPVAMADSILNKQQDSVFLSNNKSYSLLKEQLRRYHTIATQGGWQPIPAGIKNLKKGTSSPTVAAIKKRLLLTGEMSGTDTSAVYNDSLDVAIRSYQQRHGFKSDGMVTDSLVRMMNIPVEQRIEQLLVNMNRMAWMTAVQPQNVIEVNIPAFMLHVYEGAQKAFDMEVVVGKEGTNTMMFSGNLNQIVFSPYWNIPASIVKEEILPAMKNDPDYLKKRKMEIMKQTDSLPTIRQLPGPENSLGKAKFLFPNSFDIYLHDTPNKSLFASDKRAFSHGCIRLADAEKMAQYLLRNDPEWTPEKIKTAMNSGKEQYVKLKNPVPVLITYFTAWVDDSGQINFREDIYGHDQEAAHKLFVIGG